MKKPNTAMMAAFLCGATAGAALAVLFAPAKGSDLRKSILKDVGEMKNLLTDVGEGLVEILSERYRSKIS